MAIITGKDNVRAIYTEAKERKWVLPCFCSENLTTTEAVLTAAQEFSEMSGIMNLPIILAITCKYDHRTQAAFYTQTRKWDIGLKLFLEDIKILTGRGSPFADLRVMIHLDHIQFDDDRDLLNWDLKQFSSMMFDASKEPFADNIWLTRQFVRERCSEIVIEGACDEIVDASGHIKSDLTTADKAEQFYFETGVDLIVANLGTEHRASRCNLQYRGDFARTIQEKIGCRIVLHGASSVPSEQIADLFSDGICKVNLWTTLERDSTPVLFSSMVSNAAKVAGPALVKDLKTVSLLGPGCSESDQAHLDYFTTLYRQTIIFTEMKRIVTEYLNLWYR